MRVDIMMPSADAERTEMKEQKKSKSLEIVEEKRAPEKVSLKDEVTAMKGAAKSHDEQAKAPEIAVSAR